MATEISKQLKKNEKIVEIQCQNCADILFRKILLGKEQTIACLVVYVETTVDNMILQQSVLGRMLMLLQGMEEKEILPVLQADGLGISDMKQLDTIEKAVEALLAGNSIVFVDGYDQALKISVKGYPGLGTQKAESEKVLRGSKEAFSESIKLNTALIRKRLRDTRMKTEEITLGTHSHTVSAFLYVEGIVYPQIVEEAKERLNRYEIDGVFDTGTAEQLMDAQSHSLFPAFQMTERPDKAAAALLEGRAVFLCDHSPSALLFPSVFHNFFQTSDDYYSSFGIAGFLRMIRYLGFFLAVTFPAIYLSMMLYHTWMLPVPLILSLAKARAEVPFGALIEVLFLEFSFELLREAGVRMPGPIGNTIGIVGGLIVGQAAVEANLVSPVVVVAVAVTILGTFAIPSQEIAEAARIWKYVMILLAYLAGMIGCLIGWYLLFAHLSSRTSLKIPYLMPWEATQRQGQGGSDGIFRSPLEKMDKRPVFAKRDNRIRLKKKE